VLSSSLGIEDNLELLAEKNTAVISSAPENLTFKNKNLHHLSNEEVLGLKPSSLRIRVERMC
jgi:hypothetical protein